MTEHAKLSASGAHRWMLCPGSVKAEENIPEQNNKYADEGTKAHNIAANKLNSIYHGQATDDTYYGDELEKATDQYVEYVKDLKIFCDYRITYLGAKPYIFIEEKVDYSNLVTDGFGTTDCIIVDREELHIIDFKYGLNRIYAKDNMQLLLYAIGALNSLKINIDRIEDDIRYITLHIVQPRINNFSTWEISYNELTTYYKYINHKALEALKDDAPRIPSEEACRWCKARFTCYALKNVTKDVVDLSNKQDLTDSDIRYVLDNAKLVKTFISSLEQRIYEQIESGGQFEGYKIVDGRSTRKLREDAQEKLVALLGEKAYSKSIINITELDKLLTKDEVNSLVYLSKAKPRLVKDNGNNESIEFDSLIFESIE